MQQETTVHCIKY